MYNTRTFFESRNDSALYKNVSCRLCHVFSKVAMIARCSIMYNISFMLKSVMCKKKTQQKKEKKLKKKSRTTDYY